MIIIITIIYLLVSQCSPEVIMEDCAQAAMTRHPKEPLL